MPKKILKIGLTGGIGSGKSTVARIFSALGYALYEADARAKALMVEDAELVRGIREAFGGASYFEDGSLNRAHLAEIVFGDPDRLAVLNRLVHPATGRDSTRWIERLHDEGYDKPFALKEAAILFESGAYRGVDAVIAVYAPRLLRLERVVSRDRTTPKAVRARMDRQWPEGEKIRRADFTIYNDGVHLLIPQVREALQYFKNR